MAVAVVEAVDVRVGETNHGAEGTEQDAEHPVEDAAGQGGKLPDDEPAEDADPTLPAAADASVFPVADPAEVVYSAYPDDMMGDGRSFRPTAAEGFPAKCSGKPEETVQLSAASVR